MNQNCPFLDSVKPTLTQVNPEEMTNQYTGQSVHDGSKKPDGLRKPENQVEEGTSNLSRKGEFVPPRRKLLTTLFHTLKQSVFISSHILIIKSRKRKKITLIGFSKKLLDSHKILLLLWIMLQIGTRSRFGVATIISG